MSMNKKYIGFVGDILDLLHDDSYSFYAAREFEFEKKLFKSLDESTSPDAFLMLTLEILNIQSLNSDVLFTKLMKIQKSVLIDSLDAGLEPNKALSLRTSHAKD